MIRSTPAYLILSSMLLLCIGTFSAAEEKKPGPAKPPTIEEQIENLERMIRRNEKKAMEESDPVKRERHQRMARNYEIVKSKKMIQAKGKELTKADRKEIKKAYMNIREIPELNTAEKTEKKVVQKEEKPKAKREARAAKRRTTASPNTYETDGGFKVRLKMPE